MGSPVEHDAEVIRAMSALVPDRWHRALLIARCVQPGAGQGRRSDLVQPTDKVSAREFATLVDAEGFGHANVSRVYAVWQFAAATGLVPDADDLVPGQDVELPEVPWAEVEKALRETEPPRQRRTSKGHQPSPGQRVMIRAINAGLRAATELPARLAMTPDERESTYTEYAAMIDAFEQAWARVVERDDEG